MQACPHLATPLRHSHLHSSPTHPPTRARPFDLLTGNTLPAARPPHPLTNPPRVTSSPPTPQVSVCPFDLLTGYTLFVEDEDRSANAVLTRADMEAHMVGGAVQACGRPWLGLAYFLLYLYSRHAVYTIQ